MPKKLKHTPSRCLPKSIGYEEFISDVHERKSLDLLPWKYTPLWLLISLPKILLKYTHRCTLYGQCLVKKHCYVYVFKTEDSITTVSSLTRLIKRPWRNTSRRDMGADFKLNMAGGRSTIVSYKNPSKSPLPSEQCNIERKRHQHFPATKLIVTSLKQPLMCLQVHSH